ncbi:MAG: hypothetical protein HY252_17950 [Sphingobacteriales bacterium]|nr:hypothetical protein [Sphingobacteriales bacterium]
MADNEQITVLLVLLIGFIILFSFIRLWPFKSEVEDIGVIRYRKLNILTGEIAELNETEMRKDISVLTGKGYEMAILSELKYFTENEIKPEKKMFLILNNSEINQFVEVVTKQLTMLNADIIFYKPVIVKQK